MFCIKAVNKTDSVRVNEQIRAKEVRVILDDGQVLGLMSSREAVEIANDKGLDLVEVSPNAKPPVCKIMNYSKFRYEKEKREKENRKKQKNVVIKELRIKPHIDTDDLETKKRQITKFLEKENKVKISLKLSGREKQHMETAIKVLDDIANQFEKIASVDKKYGKEQVQKYIMITPKK